MIPETLITYIETAIIPRYKEFDKAHNLSHVRTVIEESLDPRPAISRSGRTPGIRHCRLP